MLSLPYPSPPALREPRAVMPEEADRRNTAAGEREYRPAFLSTLVAARGERRLALVVILLSAIGFIAALPFVRVPLVKVPAFIPSYESALLINDLITAVLLFGQFTQTRSRALLALACGYLFDALMIIPHALTFPGVFSPTGLLGAGEQTTAWLYVFWHGGFPVFVLAYAWFGERGVTRDVPRGHARTVIACAIGGMIVVSAALTLLATVGHDLLPVVIRGGNYSLLVTTGVSPAVWALTFIALLVLWRRSQSTVLDLWLMVVMCVWLFDIALSAVIGSTRYDLGFYAGRCYGLVAASFVLAMLIIETSGLHSRLAAATAQLGDHARELEERVCERTEELLCTNRELNAIIEASPVAIYMLDHDGAVTLWKASAERIFGYTEAEALGGLPPDFIAEHLADFRADLERAVSGGSATDSLETQRRRKDGKTIDVLARWAPVNDETGRMLGIMYTVVDITERKKLESQLQQSQKMEAVGNLTAGMAHDFNNLLGVIIGSLDLLQDQQIGNPDKDELTHEALDAALRGADLTRRLLAFARRQPLQPARTDINELVARTSQLLGRTLGEEIEITLELGTEVWPVVVDPAQLESSLTNLATNARDAMPKGGHLIIATSNSRLDEDYASQHAEVKVGDYAMIEISDTGTGMLPEIASHIFEPFYTTKEEGKGTGLGLSMVFGFIKQSGGHINVYSEVGIGTTFRLYLPPADVGAEAARAAPSQALVRGCGETVLTVEDNASLRRVVVRQLNELGYRVLQAEDAQAALKILESETVELLLTDIVMPGGISGYELAVTALSRWPEMKIVLTSGFPGHKINVDGVRHNFRLLSKPCRRDDLARTIREVLEG